MVFSCEKSILSEAVMNVSRMIPSKSTIPALEGIKIKARDGLLTLCGYDMEAGITTELPADIKSEGEIILAARLFADMIRKMDGNIINISVGDRYLTSITSGITEFNILGIPADEFPELPSVEQGEAVEIGQGILKSMIDQTLFAVASTDSKPVHMGSLFDLADSCLSIVSVDGYRLALRRERLSNGKKLSFVVPGKVLSEISKMLSDDAEETAKLLVSARHIVFSIGNYSIISRLLEGEFLDYKKSIPQMSASTAIISRRQFMDSIERASLLISDRLRSPIRIIFDRDSMVKISCSTSVGKFYDEFACKIEGDSVEMGFNNRYLMDGLRAADTDEVRVEISGALSPIKILPPEGDSYLFLVLPVRLKNE
ncbi:MAG: DNA polymerase III subunit beta [Oscillospiraceae bacterium]|nr:DNA polymerase III subunit beta [Oscillospiraceae bacterium]